MAEKNDPVWLLVSLAGPVAQQKPDSCALADGRAYSGEPGAAAPSGLEFELALLERAPPDWPCFCKGAGRCKFGPLALASAITMVLVFLGKQF